MQRFLRRYQLWLGYALFLIIAMIYGGREGLVLTQPSLQVAKIFFLAIYLGFFAFSLYATRHENFFRSIAKVNALLWGRQVGIDLYISVLLSLAVIWLVEGSMLVMLVWLVPVLIFANLAILPYILLNFAEIAGHLTP